MYDIYTPEATPAKEYAVQTFANNFYGSIVQDWLNSKASKGYEVFKISTVKDTLVIMMVRDAR